MSRRRVVVTGLGLISPVGNNVADGWANLVAGKSGIATVTKFDASNLACHFAGEVKGFSAEEYIPAKEARSMDTFIHYGIAAGVQAKDSGLEVNEANAERIGVMVGSGIGGLPMIEDTHQTYVDRGPRRISPFFVPGSIINMISGHLSMFGLNLAAVTACTTGLQHRPRRAPDPGRRRRRDGAGGAESSVAARHRRFRGSVRCRPATTIQRIPPVGQGPRRLRAGRGCRCDGARGVRSGGTRREDLRGSLGLRHDGRRVPHDRAEHGRPVPPWSRHCATPA